MAQRKKPNTDTMDLFQMGGGSIVGDAPGDQPGEGGSTPTPSLQLISPKEIRLERISMAMADAYSIEHHYLHRTASNSKIAFGIFARNELHGIMIWGLPVAPLKGQNGTTWTTLELRRMYCDERLGRNSESRCLSIASRILARLFANCRLLIAYSDTDFGHKGTIYKAAGWRFDGHVLPDKDGGWSKHPRHNRVETGAKKKWYYPVNSGI